MKITADTNLMVRAITRDDRRQSPIAESELANADLVALPLPMLCELVWVLARGYKIPVPEISAAIRRLTDAGNVSVNRPAVSAGIAMLDLGGDFADGVTAYEGIWLGGETFVSFDRQAISLMAVQGRDVRLLE